MKVGNSIQKALTTLRPSEKKKAKSINSDVVAPTVTEVTAAAKRWQGRGVAVLPINAPVKGDPSSGKAPATRHGVKDATKDIAEFENLLNGRSAVNLAVAAGKDSNLLIFDVDTRHNGHKTLAKQEKQLGRLPPTWKMLTGGGGCHLYFAYPAEGFRPDTRGKLLGEGVDVLSGGSYAIVAPSIHWSGGHYRWAKGFGPASVKLAELPPAWREHMQRQQEPNRSDGNKKAAAASTADDDKSWKEGTRNSNLTSLAGKLHNQGLSEDALAAALLAENKAKCSPPLGEDEVRKIAASIASKARLGGPDGKPDLGRLVAQAVLDRHYAGGIHLVAADGQFMAYANGLWSPVQKAEVEKQVLNILPDIPEVAKARHLTMMRDVSALLLVLQTRTDDPFHWNSTPRPVINCKNCEVWLRPDGTIKIRPHRASSYLVHQIAVDYDEEATCPKYDAALKEIFSDADDPEDMIRHWHEVVGYIIQTRRTIAVIVVLYGRGSNGKTRLMETVQHLLGQGLVHCGPITDLAKDRFTRGSLRGKQVFLDDDVKAGIKLPDGELKLLSERKTVTGEAKFRDNFTFEARVVPVLLCNNVPSITDLSHGLTRRIQVIPFAHQFTEKDADPELFDRIWADKQEMSGILNRAIEGWQRLQKRGGKFKPTSDMLKAKQQWLVKANPLKAFLDERCERDPAATTLMTALYDAYREWATEAGITLVQQRLQVRHNLEHEGFQFRHSNAGQQILGVRLRSKLG